MLDSTEYELQPFTDAYIQGHSTSTILSRTKDEITYRCCLQKGYRYPFAGLFAKRTDDAFYSLEDYTLEMQLVARKKQRLPIRVYTFREGISDSMYIDSFVLYLNIYMVEKGENNLEIPFNSFTTTPEWWYTLNNVDEGDVGSWDINKVGSLSIFSDPGFPVGEERIFKITKLLLVGDYSRLYKLLIIFCAFVLSVFLGIHIILYQKQKRIQLTLKYSDDFDFKTKRTDLKNQIQAFISEHYSNSELKALDLATHLNVPEYKIGEILKEQTGMTFKGFLNHTRVEAAKLYLKNSSYSISEIAYKTGFNSPSSFNRVFKEFVNLAPGEFKN